MDRLVRTALTVLSKHGLSTLLAIGFAIFLAYTVNGKLEAIAAAQVAAFTDSQKQILLLRAICYGVNKDAPAMCDATK